MDELLSLLKKNAREIAGKPGQDAGYDPRRR
jgi:hypothetical protein